MSDEYPTPRETRPVYNNALADVWPQLGHRIYSYFDTISLKWTSIDAIHFFEPGKALSPIFLWVGVTPTTLSCEDAMVAAGRCKQILEEYHFPMIEIAFRESIVTRSTLSTQSARSTQPVGPMLFNYHRSKDPMDPMDLMARLCRPFTPALGLQIGLKDRPHLEGTGGLYLCEGQGTKNDRLLILTARHVVLPPTVDSNNPYEYKNENSPRTEVILLSDNAYKKSLASIGAEFEDQNEMIDFHKAEIKRCGKPVSSDNVSETEEQRVRATSNLARATESAKTLDALSNEIANLWKLDECRVIGYILKAPSILSRRYTEDWAVIEVYKDKIEWKSFKGNVMYIGMVHSLFARSSV